MAALTSWWEKQWLGPGSWHGCGSGGLGNTTFQTTNGRFNDPARKLAFKFWPTTTSPVTHFGCYQDITGTMTGITLKGQIETSASDVPSGSVQGAASDAFASRTSDGWSAEIALGTQTGALSLNTPYWLVLFDGGGTAPSSTNYWVAHYTNNLVDLSGRVRCYNGSDWTTVTSSSGIGMCWVKHLDGSYSAGTQQSNSAATGVGNHGITDVQGTNRQGISGSFGQAQTIDGVIMPLGIAGARADLEVSLYVGDTLQETVTMDDAEFSVSSGIAVCFTAVTIPASTTFYIVLHQVGDGGSAGNDYSMKLNTANAVSGAAVSPWRVVYGTSSTPSALTVSTTHIPIATITAPNLSGAGGGGVAPGTIGFNRGFD